MDGRDHQYYEELLNSIPEFSPTDYDHLYFPAGNHRQQPENRYFAAGSNHHLSASPANHHLRSPDINNSYLSPYDPLLESDFNRLSLSGAPTYPSAYSTTYDEPRSMQRMRAQSAARAHNIGLNLNPYMNSPLNLDDNFNQFPLNLNPYSTGRSNSNGGLNNGHRQRAYPPLDYRSNYESGTNWNPLYPGFGTCRQSPLTNGGIGSSLYRQPRRPIFSSLSELRGKIFLVSKDQYGCRFLQSKFEEGKLEDINMIFSELKEHICEVMVDQFGNYLVQKFFKIISEEQMSELVCLVINDERKFMDISTDMHGTRAVQKMIEHLTTADQRSVFISVLRRVTLVLTKDNNGQHVIQHCLKYFSDEENKHILNVVADNCLDVATDKSGCCVLQQCLTHSVGEPRDRLISQITLNSLILSEHPFGNYVVQYIIGFGMTKLTSDIMAQLTGNYVSLSMNKYGSNVVEQCLKQSEGDQVVPIIEELIRSPNFLRVLQDPYGNYVAQSALMASKGEAQQTLVKLVLVNYPFLHSHPHGKRVLARTKGIKLRR